MIKRHEICTKTTQQHPAAYLSSPHTHHHLQQSPKILLIADVDSNNFINSVDHFYDFCKKKTHHIINFIHYIIDMIPWTTIIQFITRWKKSVMIRINAPSVAYRIRSLFLCLWYHVVITWKMLNKLINKIINNYNNKWYWLCGWIWSLKLGDST